MSTFNLSDNSKEDISPSDASLVERRFDSQWLYAVACREAFSMAYRKPVEYTQVFAAADAYVPEILGRDVLLFQPGETKGARFYREKAALLTAKLRQEAPSAGRHIQPTEALDHDIKELEDLLKSDNGQSHTQREKLVEFRAIRQEFIEQAVIRRDERDILVHEWKRGLDLPTFFPQSSYTHHDFVLPGKRVMRIRFVHETKAETMTGVDFIYEYHRPMDQMARLVAVQYKLPDGDSKNIIIDDRGQRQLDRMRDAFCNNGLCVGPSHNDKDIDNRKYMLPHCCAFFRPTDRLQQFNARLATTGYHIRRCDIDRVCEYTKTINNNKVITPEISMKHGVRHTIFEELFNTERLGSRWLTYEQLENFHRNYEVIKPSEQGGIYIQEAPMPEPATLF